MPICSIFVALVHLGLESILIGDVIFFFFVASSPVVLVFVVTGVVIFFMALVTVNQVSILSRNTRLLIFIILFLSVASVYVPDDMMLILTGHNFILILVLMAMAPAAGGVVPGLGRIVRVLVPIASVFVGLPSALCEDLLVRDVLVSDLMALVPVALDLVTGFPGDVFVLFSVVSVPPESMPALYGSILILTATAVSEVAKLT